MAIRVGRWDCEACGHKGVLGPLTACSVCGAPRPKDVQFYLTEDAEVLDENSAQYHEAKLGADWICDFCGTDNKAKENNCRNCGNQRTLDDTERKVEEYDLENTPTSGKKQKSNTQKIQQKISQPTPQEVQKANRNKRILIIIAAVVGILVFIFYPRKRDVEITGHSWIRQINIENYREVTEQGWELPPTARQIRSFRAIHHYDKVFSHYENRTRTVRVPNGTERYKCGTRNLGNGHFEDKYCTRTIYTTKTETYQEAVYKDEPVYRTKYEYYIFRWVIDHKETAQGRGKEVTWPKVVLKNNKEWREGERTEKYTIYYKNKKEATFEEDIPFERWQKYKVGQKTKARSYAGTYRLIEEET